MLRISTNNIIRNKNIMKKNITVEILNAAFNSDPGAIRSLMLNRVPCNRMLADDKFVQVYEDRNMHGEHFSVGAIGLINAVLAANGLPLVAGKWEFSTDKPNKFVGFCEYTKNTNEVE